jgi:hypothetical protein
MWILHWFEDASDETAVVRPPEYVTYQYLGVQTFLTLPEVPVIGQETIELKTLGIYTLPDTFDWTVRALEDGRLTAA